MNSMPPPSAPVVPSINVLDPDDHSLLDGFYFPSGDTGFFPEWPPSGSPSELEVMSEFSHLPHLTGPAYSLPYTILQDNVTANLSPSSLSPAPSPTSSFSSLSPSPSYDYPSLSDSESPISPSPATPDPNYFWQSQMPALTSQSTDSLVLHSSMGLDDSFSPLGPTAHRRTKSSPSARREPVASKAMLEANSRRRRHPAQFECNECKQTFTALFSLKRHAQSHTGERPFACSVPGCTQRFFNSSDCKRHEKSKKRHKDLVQ